jgi:MraZ protein
VENTVPSTSVPPEPPHSTAQARVDDKGRLKLPSEFLEFLRQSGVDKVFITTLDLRSARLYPLSVWKSNENFFENAGEDAEKAEDVAFVAKVYGGDSEIDAQGRVLIPAPLRKELELESEPVWLDHYNGRINVTNRKVYEERMQRARVGLGDKVKALEKRGMR